MSVREIPVVYMTDGCAIDLRQVDTVICRMEAGVATCTVFLRSGVSFKIDMMYSRSLLQAVEWSRSPGSIVRPQASMTDQGEIYDNTWGN